MSPTLSIAAFKNRFGSNSLGSRVMTGSFWTMAGYGGSQILRFGSNVVLTRLLFPRAFGLMVLVNTIILGLEMFSDVGTRASLIQSKRGEDEDFLATAFTVKVLRGAMLWALAAALSYPAAQFFQKPELASLLPVASANTLLLGFRSTKTLLASRDLNLGRLTLLTLGSQVISIAVMITWAFIQPDVWSLVAGTLVGTAVGTVGSHFIFPGKRDRFGWDKSAAQEMFRFGSWIFLSTALAYLAGQGDAILMGRLLSATELGVFGIAANLARMVGEALNQLGNSVLFPAYSKVFRESPERVDKVLLKSRTILMAVGAAAYAPFVLLGSWLVDLVYDDRYTNAGWMLQTLACGFVTGLMHRSYGGILHAKGMSFESTVLQFFQVAIKFGCFLVGFYFFGLPGFIVGVAFNSWLSYPVLAAVMSRAGVWQPKPDLIALGIGAVITVLFFMFPPAGLVF